MAYRDKFLKKLDQTERALKKLKEIKTLKGKLDEEILYEVSAKRFEYTFEVLWKTIKLFLSEEGIDCNSPLECFKQFYKVVKLEEKYGKYIPKVVRFRNEIVHIYNFDTAKFIYENLEEYVIPLFDEIVKNLRNNSQYLS